MIIRSGDSDKLIEIIEVGSVSDINMRSDYVTGFSLLMIACKNGFVDCARVMLKYNADINYSTYNGSVLKSACLSGQVNMLQFIIDQGITLNDSVLSWLFDCSEITANTEIATILVGYIQDVNWGGGHDTFLCEVSKAENVDVVRHLLDRGASFCCRFHDPLVIASCRGHLEVVKLFLGWNASSGTHVTQANVDDSLIYASGDGHVEIVRCLVEYGVSTDALNSALFSAVEYHHLRVASLLIDSGADYNVLIPPSECSAWIFACRQASPFMVRMLLDHGADPNAVDANGNSPIKVALFRLEVLNVLLERGADPNQSFADGSAALLELAQHKPAQREGAQSLTVLLEHGADANIAHTTTGETALMVASLDLNVRLVEALLEHGADVTQVNREGESVLGMLGRTRQYDEVRELCSHYIDRNQREAMHILKLSGRAYTRSLCTYSIILCVCM